MTRTRCDVSADPYNFQYLTDLSYYSQRGWDGGRSSGGWAREHGTRQFPHAQAWRSGQSSGYEIGDGVIVEGMKRKGRQEEKRGSGKGRLQGKWKLKVGRQCG